MNPFLRIATPVMIFVVALVMRLLSWHSVFQQGGVYPHGNDAYYHLRRIRFSVDHFPDVLRFDPLMNFPEGAQSIWSPTFDWLMAALLRVLPGLDQPDQLESYAVSVPPILGAITVVIVYFIGLRFFSRGVAIVAALSMAILPAHSLYSRLGAVDHHVLVATIVAIMLALAMSLFRDEPEDADAPGEKKIGLCIGLGVSIAAAVLVWPGSLLHVGVLQLALVVRLLTATDAASAKLWALRFSTVHFVAFLVIAPMSIGNTWQLWGPFSPVVLTNFHPLYFLAASICFAMLGGMWQLGWGETTRQTRLISAFLVAGGLILGLLVAIPDLVGAIAEAVSWFAKDEEFQSAVNESVPLFGGERGSARAVSILGRIVYVVPLAIAYFAWQLRDRAEVLLLLGWALFLFFATLVQWRFVNSYSIAHCLLIGMVAESLVLGIGPLLTTRARRLSGSLATIVVLAIVFMPPLRSYRLHIDNFGRSLRGEPTVPVGTQLHARFVADAARFLKVHSPVSASPGSPEYSVLGPWGDGHILKAVADRAVVQDNFGDDVAPENFARAEDYFSARTEAAALEILAPLKTRYVLVRSTGSGHSKGYHYASLFTRLYRLRGNSGALPKVAGNELRIKRSLVHHRLIYQSTPIEETGSPPYIMLFEIVAGAELVGEAPPHSIVNAKIRIEPRDGSPFDYITSTETDAEGVYRLHLPYSNEFSSRNVRVGRRYTVRAGSKRIKIAIAESAVLEGALIEGPTFEK